MLKLQNIFDYFKPPETLYKQKQEKEILESIKRSAIITQTGMSGCSMKRLGLSEYGARCHLKEGTEPVMGEMVLLRNGDLITWDEWKEKNK